MAATELVEYLPMRFASWLLIAHTVGILLATVCAAIDIENIMVSLPALSLSGALVALGSFRQDHLLGFLFGLSAPSVAVFCFFVIVTLEWSPSDAQVPVSIFLGIFALLSFSACALAMLELQTSGQAQPRGPFQFSIAALLVLMVVLALVLGFVQTLEIRLFATGVSLAYLVAILYGLNRFFNNRRLRRLAQISSFLAPERKP